MKWMPSWRTIPPAAYEKVVDRLLASPRYGEHRAHYWLDVARYGDTQGLHADFFRSIWPYRDYVINAYNANKPFDQFVREQIAGDMLPNKTLETTIASAYIRAGISSGEGGTVVDELRVNNKRERIEAFGAAFMGLTTGCAVCHDHKFDPITQKDFYQLTAFFNNLTENPSNDDRKDWPPFIRLPKPGNLEAYKQVFANKAKIEGQIGERKSHAHELISAWLNQTDAKAEPVDPTGLQAHLRFDEQKGSTFANSAPGAAFKTVSATETPIVWGEGVWLWPYMRMESSTKLQLPQTGDVESNQPFTVATWVRPYLRSLEAKDKKLPKGVILARADSAQKERGWELRILKTKLVFTMANAAPANAITVETKAEKLMGVGRWNHVAVTYDGSGKASGVKTLPRRRTATAQRRERRIERKHSHRRTLHFRQ